MCPSGGSQWSWRKFAAQHKRAREAVSLSVASGTGTWSLYHQESPLSTHNSPLVTSCFCQAPSFVNSFCLQQSIRAVRCLTEVVTFIPLLIPRLWEQELWLFPLPHAPVYGSRVSLQLLWLGATQYLHFNCSKLTHNCVSHIITRYFSLFYYNGS